jgi:hypothetical protein
LFLFHSLGEQLAFAAADTDSILLSSLCRIPRRRSRQ